jgi:hypothetical protein
MRLEQIERELKKSPDFQPYIIAKARHDRTRMRGLLMEIPHFRRWRSLTGSEAHARRWQAGVHHNDRAASAARCAAQ